MRVAHTPEPRPYPKPLMSPGMFRRFAAGIYDALMIFAICMLATLLIVPFAPGRGLQTFYAHQAVLKLIYQLGLLALGFAFFGGFWTHGGQTIGMRAWKLRTVCMDGTPLGWRRALIRYLSMLIPWLLALLGCEFLINSSGRAFTNIYLASAIITFMLAFTVLVWPVFDHNRLAWHDYLSGTRLELVNLRHADKQS